MFNYLFSIFTQMDSPSTTRSPAGDKESPTTIFYDSLSPLPGKPLDLPSKFTPTPTRFSGKPILVNRHNGDEANSDLDEKADVRLPNEDSAQVKSLVLELSSAEQGEVKVSESNPFDSAKTIGFQGDSEPIAFCLNSAFDEQRREDVVKLDAQNCSSQSSLPENAVGTSILGIGASLESAGKACHQLRGASRQLDFNRNTKTWPTSQRSRSGATNLGLQISAQTMLNPGCSQLASCNPLIPVWRTRTEARHATVGSIEEMGNSFMLAPVSSDNLLSAISDTYLANGQWGSERRVTATSASHGGEQSASIQTDRFNSSIQASSTKKRMMPANIDNTGRCRHCNCKRTNCLKLYCDCFAAGIYCDDCCACQLCMNKPEYEDTVLDVRGQVTARNPLAFTSKVILETGSPANNVNDGIQATPVAARHKRGCSCKKSTCSKKYCECYQARVGCSAGCRCQGCKNKFGRREEALYGSRTRSDIPQEELENAGGMQFAPTHYIPSNYTEALYESRTRSDILHEELENMGRMQVASRTHYIPSNYTGSCGQESDSRGIQRPDQLPPALKRLSPLRVRALHKNSSSFKLRHGLFPSKNSSVDRPHELGLNSSEGLKGGASKFMPKPLSSSFPPMTPFTDPRTGGEKKLDFDPGGTPSNQSLN